MAARYKELGLEPAGDKGSYFQSVPFRASHVDAAKTSMNWTINGKQATLGFAKDFIAGTDPARPETSVDAPVVFVGYGITSAELHYDDYQGVDAKGKIVARSFMGRRQASESSVMRAHYSSGLTKRGECA